MAGHLEEDEANYQLEPEDLVQDALSAHGEWFSVVSAGSLLSPSRG